MDAGPFRTPQPPERRVPSRQEAAPRVVEEPQPVQEAPKTTHRAEIPHFDEPKKRRPLKRIILAVVIILVVIGLGFFGWTALNNKNQANATAIDTSKYQAVFFTNGQVYFGKLQAFNDQYLKLTNIYYLQTQTASTTGSSNPQTSSSDSGNVQLIKLGSEIHGPEDQMVISKDQVLFYENLKPDGKVAQSIANYSKSK
jgi:hypothetical protein